MTDALVEKIARAICLETGEDPDAADLLLIGGRPGFRPNWEGYEIEARACLLAIDSSGTHVVVPTEPTATMLLAGASAKPIANKINTLTALDAYMAMLSARPKVTP